jgi:hypothetical protein
MRPRTTPPLLVLLLSCANACSGSGAPVAGGAPPPVAAPTAPATPAQSVASSPAAAPGPPGGQGSCGGLGCTLFATPGEAFAAVLATKPRMLGIGETHAQKGTEGVESATSRFTKQLLPKLAGLSTDIVLELWIADGKCGKKEQQAAAAQKPVTESQASSNQNEFVTLGHAAKALGIQPHVLRPTCEEYDRIVAAGDGSVEQMLTMIARKTETMTKQLLARDDKLVVAYGGAMHNDLAPASGREPWSFGPQMREAIGPKYVELDIIVREYVRDTDAWKALLWYSHFDRSKHADKALLYNPAPQSYVLVFPSAG